jgi:hypothetical protein
MKVEEVGPDTHRIIYNGALISGEKVNLKLSTNFNRKDRPGARQTTTIDRHPDPSLGRAPTIGTKRFWGATRIPTTLNFLGTAIAWQ